MMRNAQARTQNIAHTVTADDLKSQLTSH
jgi:hypothetical protein